MDMNIEISLTSRSKTNYFKKTKKQKKKNPLYCWHIYMKKKMRRIYITTIYVDSKVRLWRLINYKMIILLFDK